MPTPIRNRIKAHRRVRAGDLVPHELNFRTHPHRQKATLTQEQLHQRLLELTPTVSADLQALWQQSAEAALTTAPSNKGSKGMEIRERYLVLITCRDERQQVELLRRLHGEGLECRALLS